jgi:hypothetical protein
MCQCKELDATLKRSKLAALPMFLTLAFSELPAGAAVAGDRPQLSHASGGRHHAVGVLPPTPGAKRCRSPIPVGLVRATTALVGPRSAPLGAGPAARHPLVQRLGPRGPRSPPAMEDRK